jgi:chorismate mutase
MADTDELRSMIEEIDQTIIENIATRMEIADKLAEAKKKEGKLAWDESKELEVINRYHELCEEVGLTEEEARRIADVILHISKERQGHFFE